LFSVEDASPIYQGMELTPDDSSDHVDQWVFFFQTNLQAQAAGQWVPVLAYPPWLELQEQEIHPREGRLSA
jgi:hypothetical protein